MCKHEQTGVCNWSSIVLGACHRINYITASKTVRSILISSCQVARCSKIHPLLSVFKARELQPNLFSNKAVLLSCFSFLHSLLQITTLINHKDKPKKSERTLAAIHRVGQAVSVAVGRFVAVGEAIAAENQELKDEMGQACFEARRAGEHLWLGLVFT